MTDERLFLRKVRHSRWVDSPDWLPAETIEADCLTDLQTSDNNLSIYLLPEAEEAAMRAAVAIAATRDSIDTVDYALFEVAVLEGLSLEVEVSGGGTPDSEVNAYHREVVKLSGKLLLDLATAMRKAGPRFGRIRRKELKERIALGLDEARLDREKVNRGILDKLRT